MKVQLVLKMNLHLQGIAFLIIFFPSWSACSEYQCALSRPCRFSDAFWVVLYDLGFHASFPHRLPSIVSIDQTPVS